MFHDSELCSQAGRGVPVSIHNLVRQATVHLAGEDGGEGVGREGAREYETTYKRTTVITVTIVTIFIFFCIIILITFILEMRKFTQF